MRVERDGELDQLVQRALGVGDVESAALFVAAPGSSDLRLASAAGIDGPALDGLIAAVRDPRHPIVRSLTDPGPTFDVRPMNPGGPALRSHLPVHSAIGGACVLAVAHASSLGGPERAALIDLADAAAAHLEAAAAER